MKMTAVSERETVSALRRNHVDLTHLALEVTRNETTWPVGRLSASLCS